MFPKILASLEITGNLVSRPPVAKYLFSGNHQWHWGKFQVLQLRMNTPPRAPKTSAMTRASVDAGTLQAEESLAELWLGLPIISF